MKFIVDAHLPKALARLLIDNGHDAIHTSDLQNGNDTDDIQINRISISENRIVISKDGDFYDSFSARREPFKLLHIKTGNIGNADLLRLFDKNLSAILRELEHGAVVELTRQYIIRVQD